MVTINTGTSILNAGSGIAADGHAAGASAVTGTDLPTDQVYQPAGFGSTVQIVVAASWTGTPATPQAAIVTPGTTTPVTGTAWQNIPGGSGTITAPAGGPYSLAFQDAYSGVQWRSSKNFFVGQCWGIYGQSNAGYWEMPGNQVEISLTPVNARTRRQNGGGWFVVSAANSDVAHYSTPYPWTAQAGDICVFNGEAPGIFADQILAITGNPVGLHWYEQFGEPATYFDPATGAGWNAMVGNGAATGAWNNPSYAFDLQGIIRIQGESDTGNSTLIAAFPGHLSAELAAWKVKTGRSDGSFKFGVCSLGPQSGYPGTQSGNFGLLRAAQIAWVDANTSAGAFYAGNPIDVRLRDGEVHWYDVDEDRMAKRFALTATIAAGATVSGSAGAFVTGAGPRITGYVQSGATITASLAMDGATALVMGDGSTTGANIVSGNSFQFFTSGGGAVAPTASAFSGSNIVFTFADTPTAASVVTAQHCMADAPYGMSGYNAGTSPVTPGSPVLSAIPYGNNIVPGDTIGLPIWPHGPMAVT